MKKDLTPINEQQTASLQAIVIIMKNCILAIDKEMNNCPGLAEKAFTFELSYDPEWDTIGKQIKISRKVIADGEIKNETYYIQRGFGDEDDGWEHLSVLCSKEFVKLLESTEDEEGETEGTDQ